MKPFRLARGRTLALAALLPAAASPALAQGESVAGSFHILWSYAPDAGRGVRYTLVDDRGEVHDLLLDERVLEPLGGPLALDRKRVVVHGTELPGIRVGGEEVPALRVSSVQPLQAPAPLSPLLRRSASVAPPQSGSKGYVTILCKFLDAPTVEPKPRTTYETWMGSAYGGLDHYWRETSGNRIDLQGSVLVGWYSLPRGRGDYVTRGADGKEVANLNALFNDCTAAADPDVDFSKFYGINMQFNQNLDGYSWGGSRSASFEKLPARVYGVTWMADWASMFVYAHEIGHSLGLPHSSGPYDKVYDSRWDVMSGGSYSDATVGTSLPVHTIAWHKDMLGWVPASQKVVVQPGTRQTFVLERNGSPTSAANPLLVVIPSGNGTFYTVEARRFTGYDARVPGEAVVLHHVYHYTGGSPARVVDPDGNGNPNDAGAMWTVGETFTDANAGVSVSVDAATETGFRVTVSSGYVLGVRVLQQRTASSSPVAVAERDSVGRVTASAAGLDCLARCTRAFATGGTTVALTPVPFRGYAFRNWRGACTGTGSCTVTLSDHRDVEAVFEPFTMVIGSDSVRKPAELGIPYADTLTVRGTSTTAAWAVVGGALPPGVALDAARGVLSGTPTEAGTFRFTVRATAPATAGGVSDTRAFIVTVTRPVIQPSAVLDQLLGGSSLSPDHVRYLDNTGNRNGRLDLGDVRAWLQENKQLNPALVPGLEELLRVTGQAQTPPTQEIDP